MQKVCVCMWREDEYTLQSGIILSGTLYSNIKFILDRKYFQKIIIIKKNENHFSFNADIHIWLIPLSPPLVAAVCFRLTLLLPTCEHPLWTALSTYKTWDEWVHPSLHNIKKWPNVLYKVANKLLNWNSLTFPWHRLFFPDQNYHILHLSICICSFTHKHIHTYTYICTYVNKYKHITYIYR